MKLALVRRRTKTVDDSGGLSSTSSRSTSPMPRPPAALLIPEILILVLKHCRLAAQSKSASLRGIPLVCKAWLNPGREVLYHTVKIHTLPAYRLFVHTIFTCTELAKLVRALFLPSFRFIERRFLRNQLWISHGTSADTYPVPMGLSARRVAEDIAKLIQLCDNLDYLRTSPFIRSCLRITPTAALPPSADASSSRSLGHLHLSVNSGEIPVIAELLPHAKTVWCLTLSKFLRLTSPSGDNLGIYFPAVTHVRLYNCSPPESEFLPFLTAVKGTLRTLKLSELTYRAGLQRPFEILGDTLESLTIKGYTDPELFRPRGLLPLTKLKYLRVDRHVFLQLDFTQMPPNLRNLHLSLRAPPATPQAREKAIWAVVCKFANAIGSGRHNMTSVHAFWVEVEVMGRDEFNLWQVLSYCLAQRCKAHKVMKFRVTGRWLKPPDSSSSDTVAPVRRGMFLPVRSLFQH